MAVASQVKVIRHLYSIGRTGRGSGEGLSPRLLRFAARFADPEKGYSPEEYRELISAVSQQAKAQGPGEPFSLALLVRLLTVPRPHRAALQVRALAERWSRNRLDAAIRATVGTRKNAGRRPRVPTSVEEMLSHIEGQCEAWRRWHAEVQAPPRSKAKTRVAGRASLNDLRGKRLREVADDFEAATAAVERLQLSVRKALRIKVRGYEERRQRMGDDAKEQR